MENEAQTPQAEAQAPETLTEEVKETLTDIAHKIAAEVKEAKGEVVTEVRKAVVELELADKFLVSKLESSFLKLRVELQQHQAEINRIQNLEKEVSTKFKEVVDTLFEKYGRDVKIDILDVVDHTFKPRTQVQGQ